MTFTVSRWLNIFINNYFCLNNNNHFNHCNWLCSSKERLDWQQSYLYCIMYKVQEYDAEFFTTNPLTHLFVRVWILLTFGWLHRLLRWDVWVHKTNLALSRLLKCLCQARQVNGHVYVSMRELILSISTIFLLDLETVP